MINKVKEFNKLYTSIIEKECNNQFKNILKNIDSTITFQEDYINLGTDESTNPIYNLFRSIAPSRINDESIFYHFFKKPEYILKENDAENKDDLLTDNIIQLTSLSSLSDEDSEEYSNFLKRIDSKYLENKDFQEDKRNQYVFCLTKNWQKDKDKFWNKYADQHRGVCIGFRFLKNEESKQFQENYLQGIVFRDVYYDSDNDSNFNFKFIKVLNNELLSNELFKNEILLLGAIEFAKMYKRKEKYDWENETRLLINTNVIDEKYKYLFSNNLNDIGEAKTEKKDGNKNRYYFRLKTNNCLFRLEILEIIIGKKAVVNKEQIGKICSDQKIKLCFDY